eukprot:6155177-Alexandrium_andersonii.AAC.1
MAQCEPPTPVQDLPETDQELPESEHAGGSAAAGHSELSDASTVHDGPLAAINREVRERLVRRVARVRGAWVGRGLRPDSAHVHALLLQQFNELLEIGQALVAAVTVAECEALHPRAAA